MTAENILNLLLVGVLFLVGIALTDRYRARGFTMHTERAPKSARATTHKLSKLMRAWILGFGMLLVVVVLLVLLESIYTNLSEKGWTTYTSGNSGLGGNDVSALSIDEAGRVWAGTGNGLSVLAPDGSWKTYTSWNSGLAGNIVHALAFDAAGRVWAGTADGLSVLAPDGSWTSYTNKNSGFGSNSVQELAIDEAGRVWMGISTLWGYAAYGLNVLAPDGSWTTYTSEDSGLVGHVVCALAIDEEGRVWVGTQEMRLDGEVVSPGGLSVLAPDGSWTTYTSEDSGLADNSVDALAIDEAGRVWVGTRGGLSVLTPDGSWTTYTSRNSGLVDNSVQALAIDAGGRVWAGTSGGLTGTSGGLSVLAPDGSWTTYTSGNSGLADYYVDALAIDEAGRVWSGAVTSVFRAGVPHGLSRFDERAATSKIILQPLAIVITFLKISLILAALPLVIIAVDIIGKRRKPTEAPSQDEWGFGLLRNGSATEREIHFLSRLFVLFIVLAAILFAALVYREVDIVCSAFWCPW